MVSSSVEQRLSKLERLVEKHEAVVECNRLMNRFCYLNNQHIVSPKPPITTLFAMKTPGVRVQLGQLGIFEGAKSVERIYGRRGPPPVPEGAPPGGPAREGQPSGRPPGGDRRGHLFLHPLASIYIEVGGDLKTAKGICLSIGIESASDKDGKLTPAWGWGSYGVDFIKEDGLWKIWHFHIYRIFRAPYKESWTAFNPDDDNLMPMSDAMRPDRPGKDDYPYRANQMFIFKPDPPEPYETFDEAKGY